MSSVMRLEWAWLLMFGTQMPHCLAGFCLHPRCTLNRWGDLPKVQRHLGRPEEKLARGPWLSTETLQARPGCPDSIPTGPTPTGAVKKTGGGDSGPWRTWGGIRFQNPGPPPQTSTQGPLSAQTLISSGTQGGGRMPSCAFSFKNDPSCR